MSDKDRGLYNKYIVTRLEDPDGKHATCDYFVLDLQHDPHAVAALYGYAESCDMDGYPVLAAELRSRADRAAEQHRKKD